jgi:hypothetical protein
MSMATRMMDKRIRDMCQDIDRAKLATAQEGVTVWAENLLDESETLRRKVEELTVVKDSLTAQLAFKEVTDHPNDLLDVGAICDARDRLQQQCFNAGNEIAELCVDISDLKQQLAASKSAFDALAVQHADRMTQLAAMRQGRKELSAVLEGVEIPFNLHEKIRYLLMETI